MPDKQGLAFSLQIQEKLRNRLASTGALSIAKRAAFASISLGDNRKMRRELLDLRTEQGIRRWQNLHNNKERYEVISSKDSDQRGESHCHLIYYELGEDLPDSKSAKQLRDECKESEEKEG
jgi:hypothetical protein